MKKLIILFLVLPLISCGSDEPEPQRMTFQQASNSISPPPRKEYIHEVRCYTYGRLVLVGLNKKEPLFHYNANLFVVRSDLNDPNLQIGDVVEANNMNCIYIYREKKSGEEEGYRFIDERESVKTLPKGEDN